MWFSFYATDKMNARLNFFKAQSNVISNGKCDAAEFG